MSPADPAPSVPPSSGSPSSGEADFTVDAFHYGKFWLVQPKAVGHRSGMDAMLVAATVPDGAKGRVADLGAGAGGAGLAVAARLLDVTVTLVERSPVMVDYARRTLALAENAALAPRVGILAVDVTLRGDARRAAGLEDDAYDFVVMNPPFNEAVDRRTPDSLKAEARAMDGDGLFEDWIRTACALLRPGGQVSIIARPRSLAPILDALAGRFGAVEVMPVHSRAGDDALRILVTAVKQSRGWLTLRPPLVIHSGPGHDFSPEMDAFNNGLAAIPRRNPVRLRR
jgi:Predicted O-methyltransferase